MQIRGIDRIIDSVPTSDGAGVRLRRSLGSRASARLDPFLLLDEFASDDAADYIAGFPPHPHRGFETVTYMLDGHMRHEDHLGHHGDLAAGGVQWMTAGRGIIHSEMPQQAEGRMRGFQLWLNLPAAEKMRRPDYWDIDAGRIPEAELAGGGRIRVIAGAVEIAGERLVGPAPARTTEPLYLDLSLPPGADFELPLPATHNALVYVFEGGLRFGGQEVAAQQAGLLSAGDAVALQAASEGARLLLLGGKPLNEPVVQYGPFVMTSREEIEQALRDYRDGTLTAA